MIKNAYIHIPFCKSKCRYCLFNSFVNYKRISEYFESLNKQIDVFYKKEKLNTLYFGGGTPSFVDFKYIAEILKKFNFEKDAEITLECNPEDVTEDFVQKVKASKINRISMGCQTFNNKILKIIGRTHDKSTVINAVKLFQNNGLNNISLDFIYGLPSQSSEDFQNDIKQCIELNIPHVSLYGLKIEKGSFFYKSMPDNLPDNDFQADMYLIADKYLKINDFLHYEISNFAKKGFESKHNINYWKNNTYYGFGCGASGYTGKERYTLTTNIKKYIDNPTEVEFKETITPDMKLEEEIILGFRNSEGINIPNINKKFKIDFEKKYKNILTKFDKYFIKTGNHCSLNINGMLISNEILSEFTE